MGDLLAGLVLLVLVAVALRAGLGLPGAYPVEAVALYLGAALLILFGVPDVIRGSGLGPANRVTLGRLVLVLPVAALSLQPGVAAEAVRWTVVAVGTLALVLDGVDGWVARRTGTGTAFGARFDMEVDAFLILALSVLAWRAGPVGPWILGIGALRYLFVAAGAAIPALRAELPPSLRRKVVCVVQGIALLVCLGPVVPPVVAVATGAAALGALAGSFAVDVVWALRAATPVASEPGPNPTARPGHGPAAGSDLEDRRSPRFRPVSPAPPRATGSAPG